MAEEKLSGTINKKARPSPHLPVSVEQPPAFVHDKRYFSNTFGNLTAQEVPKQMK